MTNSRLTPQDAAFLYLEGGPVHMHVGVTMIFEGPSLSYDELVEHIESRLHLVPKFRQRLAHVPLGIGRPVWVDEPNLDIHYHVRYAKLPQPVSDQELRRFIGGALSKQLDRAKPLWEITLVPDLEGDRFAVFGKTHHCLVDGISGVDITVAMCDFAREPDAPPKEDTHWQPAPVPSRAQLFTEALAEKLTKPFKVLWRLFRTAYRSPRSFASSAWKNLAGIASITWTVLHSAPKTPLNIDLGPDRTFAWAEAKLDDLKAINNTLGGTVNDIALAIVTGALRRWLPTRGVSTDALELKALVPINLRTETEQGVFENKVSGVIAPLPVYAEDPEERLRTISKAMVRLKGGKQAVGAGLLSANFPRTITRRAPRLFNLCVTNMPGPQVPMYLMGRKLQALMPILPIAKGQALGVAVTSYNGEVFFALIADQGNLPELDDFQAYFDASIAEYAAIVGREREAETEVAFSGDLEGAGLKR